MYKNVKSSQTLKYSNRSLQVTLFPPISFSTSRSGARRRGTRLASSFLKSPSMSEKHHTHTLVTLDHTHDILSSLQLSLSIIHA